VHAYARSRVPHAFAAHGCVRARACACAAVYVHGWLDGMRTRSSTEPSIKRILACGRK